jgi:segregation and condensation protein A
VTSTTVDEVSTPAAGAKGDRDPRRGGASPGDADKPRGFQVHLDNFEGPFDLLLALIAKHKLDITEVSLHKITDEFIAYTRSHGSEWDLDQASHFLLVAATLLDLKAARLLPAGEVDDEEDLALLEARDLLFARLLQYRAYKQVARVFSGRMAEEARRFPRTVPMEPRFADLLPEVLLGLGPAEFARLAAKALTPKAPPTVSIEHIYQPKASVREQAIILVGRLRRVRRATFRSLTGDCEGLYEIVARFLALLELYREQAVSFEQIEPLGELHITWTGSDEGDIEVGDDYEGAHERKADERRGEQDKRHDEGDERRGDGESDRTTGR